MSGWVCIQNNSKQFYMGNSHLPLPKFTKESKYLDMHIRFPFTSLLLLYGLPFYYEKELVL